MDEDKDYMCLPKGSILKDKYEVRKNISVSELSMVYIGMDSACKRKCIIKEYFPRKLVLRDMDHKSVLCKMPSLKSKYLHERELFLNEALILKSSNHINIAKCMDYFIENNSAYIVIEYYEGKTLDQYMKDEEFVSIPAFLRQIYIPVINAVDSLHKKGVIHRDIKPTNIIISQEGIPVMIDFGSAINYRESEKKKIFVTAGFSPLEFYSTKSKQGRYSDIYSIVATLYYYLCGEIPIDAPTRVIEDNIKNVHEYNESVSGLFSWVIMKNLSLNHTKRFSSLKLLKWFIRIEYYILKFKDRKKNVTGTSSSNQSKPLIKIYKEEQRKVSNSIGMD